MLLIETFWPVISKFAGGGLLVWIGALVVARLKADKKRYLLTIEHLDSAVTQIGAIVGTPASLAQDIDRCRATESFRRKAGELIQEAYTEKHRSSFRKRLKSIGSQWADLEDELQAEKPNTQTIRGKALGVLEEYQALKMALKVASTYRPSLIILGRLPPEGK